MSDIYHVKARDFAFPQQTQPPIKTESTTSAGKPSKSKKKRWARNSSRNPATDGFLQDLSHGRTVANRGTEGPARKSKALPSLPLPEILSVPSPGARMIAVQKQPRIPERGSSRQENASAEEDTWCSGMQRPVTTEERVFRKSLRNIASPDVVMALAPITADNRPDYSGMRHGSAEHRIFVPTHATSDMLHQTASARPPLRSRVSATTTASLPTSAPEPSSHTIPPVMEGTRKSQLPTGRARESVKIAEPIRQPAMVIKPLPRIVDHKREESNISMGSAAQVWTSATGHINDQVPRPKEEEPFVFDLAEIDRKLQAFKAKVDSKQSSPRVGHTPSRAKISDKPMPKTVTTSHTEPRPVLAGPEAPSTLEKYTSAPEAADPSDMSMSATESQPSLPELKPTITYSADFHEFMLEAEQKERERHLPRQRPDFVSLAQFLRTSAPPEPPPPKPTVLKRISGYMRPVESDGGLDAILGTKSASRPQSRRKPAPVVEDPDELEFETVHPIVWKRAGDSRRMDTVVGMRAMLDETDDSEVHTPLMESAVALDMAGQQSGQKAELVQLHSRKQSVEQEHVPEYEQAIQRAGFSKERKQPTQQNQSKEPGRPKTRHVPRDAPSTIPSASNINPSDAQLAGSQTSGSGLTTASTMPSISTTTTSWAGSMIRSGTRDGGFLRVGEKEGEDARPSSWALDFSRDVDRIFRL